MDHSTHDGSSATFILRLWRAPQSISAESSIWRGTAVHVQSGTERGVQGLNDLLSFIETWMDSGLQALDREK
jgi:hypothetical protein